MSETKTPTPADAAKRRETLLVDGMVTAIAELSALKHIVAPLKVNTLAAEAQIDAIVAQLTKIQADAAGLAAIAAEPAAA